MNKIIAMVTLIMLIGFVNSVNCQSIDDRIQQDSVMMESLGLTNDENNLPEIPNWEEFDFWYACFTATSTSSIFPFDTVVVAGCNGSVKWIQTGEIEPKKWKKFVKSIDILHRNHFGVRLNWGEFSNIKKYLMKTKE